jgi:hypothetical protein
MIMADSIPVTHTLNARPSRGLRWVKVLGAFNYVQAGLCFLVAAVAAWLAFMFWDSLNLPNAGFPADYDGFGAGAFAVDAIIMTVIACFLGLFSFLSFLVGNRLMRCRWRGFCLGLAYCESLLGLVPIGLGVISLVSAVGVMTSAQNHRGPLAYIGFSAAALLVTLLSCVPTALGVQTIVTLGRPSVRVLFGNNFRAREK